MSKFVRSVPIDNPQAEGCDMCGRRTIVRRERGIDVVFEFTRGRGTRPHSCPGYFGSRPDLPRVFQAGLPGGGRR